MKVIFSRKGFDSSAGGCASPILPDGRLLSFPIPSESETPDRFTPNDLYLDGIDVNQLLHDLRKKETPNVHLDPNLVPPKENCPEHWRPILGQAMQAQSHLANHNVNAGDVFLFWGWYRAVELHNGKWRYVPSAPNLSIIWGWLEVDEVVSMDTQEERLRQEFFWHAHAQSHYEDKSNTLYVAKEHSQYAPNSRFGGGIFSQYNEQLCLTKAGESRSKWQLPSWFKPKEKNSGLTYHHNPNRWQDIDDNNVMLSVVGRGQEFIINSNDYPELENWAANIICSNAK